MTLSSPEVFVFPGKNPDVATAKNQLFVRVARERGFSATVVDFVGVDNPEDRVRKALAIDVTKCRHVVFVGVSMGGYVATVAAESLGPIGLFLVSPALYMEPYQNLDPKPKAQCIALVHGLHDQIIPVRNVSRFAEKFGAELHLLEGDHSLLPHLPLIADLFGHFLERVGTKPNQPPEPTTTAVTIPAAQEVVPAAVVAHL